MLLPSSLLLPCMQALALWETPLFAQPPPVAGMDVRVVIKMPGGGAEKAVQTLSQQVANAAIRGKALKGFLSQHGSQPDVALPPLEQSAAVASLPSADTSSPEQAAAVVNVAASTSTAPLASTPTSPSATTAVTPAPMVKAAPDAYGLNDSPGETVVADFDPEEASAGLLVQKPIKVATSVDCAAENEELKPQKSWGECAAKAVEAGGTYFAFGTGWKSGKCNVEKTTAESCPEGKTDGFYDFYKLQPVMIKSLAKKEGVACSAGVLVATGMASSDECSKKIVFEGKAVFLYGKGAEAGRCLSLESASCGAAASFESGDYELFEVEETPV